MIPGAEKPEIQELPRMSDRLSFVYLEYCNINRSDSAVRASNSKGSVDIPASAISCVMLGPGTSITHRAVELLGDTGACIVWVGESGVRLYAHGRPLTHSSSLLEAQARAVSNRRSRLAVARTMYQMRFPGEDVSRLTMQQLRGREGVRIREVYRRWSRETGVPWNGRNYDRNAFESGDTVNRALSAANSCLYGIVHSVIVAMGCSPGLGFIHTGNERSFVFDIADLYKTETSIPIAFRIAAEGGEGIGSRVRRTMRDTVASSNLLDTISRDIRYLLKGDDEDPSENRLLLWDDLDGSVEGGVSYAGEDRR